MVCLELIDIFNPMFILICSFQFTISIVNCHICDNTKSHERIKMFKFRYTEYEFLYIKYCLYFAILLQDSENFLTRDKHIQVDIRIWLRREVKIDLRDKMRMQIWCLRCTKHLDLCLTASSHNNHFCTHPLAVPHLPSVNFSHPLLKPCAPKASALISQRERIRKKCCTNKEEAASYR